MKKIIVCDDDPNILSWFKKIIQRDFGITIEARYIEDPKVISSLIMTGYQPDMIFLDLLYQNTTGIKAVKPIRFGIPECKIILISSSDDFFYEGYSIHAYDYLIKPLSSEAIYKILHQETENKHNSITLKIRKLGIETKTHQLMYVESRKHHLIFHSTNGEIKIYGKINDYQDILLGCGDFVRCHQSYLVNLSYVKDIKGKDFILKNNCIIPIRKQDIAKMKTVFYSRLLNGAIYG